MIELLIIIGIIGIIGAIAFMNLRPVLRGQEERAAVQSVQQTVWQGATAAASRGSTLELTRTGSTFRLIDTANSRLLKEFVLPLSVTTNWPEGQALVFTPPGRIETNSLLALPQLWIAGEGRTTDLTVSLIGEVKAVAR